MAVAVSNALITIDKLKKHFRVKDKGILHAVDDVSADIQAGETLGLVGESGCGKSTIGRVVVGLLVPTAGDVRYQGQSVFSVRGEEKKLIRRKIQMVFQDPYSSLNPRKTVRDILAAPFEVHGLARRDALRDEVERLAQLTGINREILGKYPHELDGGKRQTVGIARALALHPDFVVCDEPVSSLDVSIQAQIINLLMDLQEKLNLTYLFISHDLSVVRHLSRRIAVMYLGKIVESADTDELFANARHPYTKALLSAVPSTHSGQKMKRIILTGDVPSPINPKPGCRFHPRCWLAEPICREIDPQLLMVGNGHSVSCHLTK